MNTNKQKGKWLTTLAAVCSSVFLLAACEPQNGSPAAEGPTDPETTYGDPPDRDQESATEDQLPSDGVPSQGTEPSDQWEEDPSPQSQEDPTQQQQP